MGIVRLHITQLAVETIHSFLLRKVLADRAAVACMSFHAIPSFPEKSYGYLDYERDVAEGIKKKLNGSLFWQCSQAASPASEAHLTGPGRTTDICRLSSDKT